MTKITEYQGYINTSFLYRVELHGYDNAPEYQCVQVVWNGSKYKVTAHWVLNGLEPTFGDWPFNKTQKINQLFH